MRHALRVVVVLGASTHGFAGPVDDARSLFELGQKQIDANQVDAACTSFATSLQLDPQVGTRLNLADCRERQGRLIEAYKLFVASIDEAARAGKAGREKFARDRAAALDAKLVKLELRVATPAPRGLTIAIAGHALVTEEWTQIQLAMPGAIAVTATAPDREPFRTSVTGVAGGKLAVDVPALGPFRAEASPPPPRPAEPPPPPHDRLPMYVGGTGCGLVLASLAIGAHAKSRYDTAFGRGDADGVGSAQREADLATGVAIAGIAAVAVGVVLYVRDRGHREPRVDHVDVTPVFGDRSVGIALAGPL